MREAVELYRGSLPGRLMPNLVGAMAQRPELARAVRDGFLARRRAALREVLRRGIERGDLRPDLDLELALDVFGGPLFYRLLVTGGPIDEQLAEGVAELILRGFAPDGSARSQVHEKTRSTHDEDPCDPDRHGGDHDRLARGRRSRPAPPAAHDPRPQWTEPLPIYAFAIEHPEGVIVVDTGESARASQPGYFPRWHPVFRSRFASGSSPSRRSARSSSSSGSRPRRPPGGDDASAHRPRRRPAPLPRHGDPRRARGDRIRHRAPQGQLRGYPNTRWPAWFDPTPLDLEPEPLGPFPQSLRLTKAGDVTLVPVPGHSPGQLGVLVEDGDHTVFLAGDSSYTQELMLRGMVDGVGARRGCGTPHAQADPRLRAENPTVYLVAHDPDTGIGSPNAASSQRSKRSWRHDRLQTSVNIERPVEEVFAYVSDPRNLPAWNSAVQAVRPTSPATNGVGSTYSMKRQLPTGRRPTSSRSSPASRHASSRSARRRGQPHSSTATDLAAQNGETVVQLDAQVELAGSRPVCPARRRRQEGSTTTSRP